MAQIFTVTCPSCGRAFPVHPELWEAGYDLLCPFCGTMFPQEASPLITTGTGERRPGRDVGRPASPATDTPGASRRPPAGDKDPSASAESM